MLPLPKHFDSNEWFIIIFSIIFIITAFLSPKRFPLTISVFILLFVSAVSKVTDYLLAASIPFDLYDYNDTAKLDLFDLLLHFVLYPVVGYLLLYFYDFWISKNYNKLLFILITVAGSVIYEWFSVINKVFTYKGWSLSYSAVSYVILITMDIIFYYLIKKWYNLSRMMLTDDK